MTDFELSDFELATRWGREEIGQRQGADLFWHEAKYEIVDSLAALLYDVRKEHAKEIKVKSYAWEKMYWVEKNWRLELYHEVNDLHDKIEYLNDQINAMKFAGCTCAQSGIQIMPCQWCSTVANILVRAQFSVKPKGEEDNEQ